MMKRILKSMAALAFVLGVAGVSSAAPAGRLIEELPRKTSAQVVRGKMLGIIAEKKGIEMLVGGKKRRLIADELVLRNQGRLMIIDEAVLRKMQGKMVMAKMMNRGGRRILEIAAP